MDASGDGGWLPRPERAAASWSDAPFGPYRLGPLVRRTRWGATQLAIHPEEEQLLELEHYLGLANAPQDPLMQDFARVSGLRHRHLATLVGVGVHDGAPYVVRAHRPGRALAEALERGPLEPETAIGVLFAVAEAVGFVAGEGHQPGVCAFGGFDADDVWLGFEGTVHLHGIGLQSVREAGAAPLVGDLSALAALADRLVPELAIAVRGDAASFATALRKAHPEACGRRASRLGQTLRSRFAESIPNERAALGLPTLH